MKQITIRRLGVASVAKYVGIAYALVGAVYGFIALFAGLAVVLDQEQLDTLGKIFSSVGVVLASLLVVPGVLFLAGWLHGAIFSLIANLILQTSRGIEIDFEDKK